MGTRTRCFFLKPTTPRLDRRWLRRYASDTQCPQLVEGHAQCHNAMFLLGDQLVEDDGWEGGDSGRAETLAEFPLADSRWPLKCACGYEFLENDARQLFTRRIYYRVDTGEMMTLDDAPPGAMWYRQGYEEFANWCGPDGKALIVKLPDRSFWHVDGRANNCTMKEDNVHRCWVRTGTPPDITVGKEGNTCSAGAGSIQTSRWHGFLRGGCLEEC